MSTVIEDMVTAAMVGAEPRIFTATMHYSTKGNPTKVMVREYYRKVVDLARSRGFDGKATMIPEGAGRFRVEVGKKQCL